MKEEKRKEKPNPKTMKNDKELSEKEKIKKLEEKIHILKLRINT